MPEESQRTHRDKPEQGDKFIPPPMDPYATYQTPYERRQATEPNPFIEFRRFADKQLSDLFSGVSNIANFPKMFGMDDGMKNFRDQIEKDFKEMMALHETWEERYKKAGVEPHRHVSSSAKAAVSSDPSQSSNRPFKEVVAENKQRPTEYSSPDWVTASDDNGKKYYINLSTGHAVEQSAAVPPTPKVQQSEDPKTRWRRGFRNCPELKKYQGETELDVYEALEDQQRSSRSPESSNGGRPSWSSWLSAYGYDGKQKSKKASDPMSIDTVSQENDSSIRPCETKTYHALQAKRMDPLRNDHEFLPWIILSPYSPLSLANPEWANVKSAKLHNGCEGGCSSPMHIYSHRHQDNSITEEDDKLRAMLADKVFWADAFEDLISLERTGKMPNREVDGRIHPRNMTSSWIRDMIEKGLLGPRWWVENGEIRRDSRNDPKERSLFLKSDAERPEEERRILRETQEAAAKARAEIDALIPNYLALTDQHMKPPQQTDEVWYGKPWAAQPSTKSTQVPQQTILHNEESLVQAESQSKSSTPSEPSSTKPDVSPVLVQPKQQQAQTPTPKKSVISTLTTMTTRTFSDGSVETKRVLKKRFADGKEESEESTEVVHPQAPEIASSKKLLEQQKNQGWFWT